ncbi:MAG TPA: L-histidine N(alpha)-methyltransferase [Phycisphaerae bacterium]
MATGRDQLTLIDIRDGSLPTTLGDDVRAGLSAQPKRLPCRYFYDREGSRLFEEICTLPEYYLTRAETEILTAHAEELAQQFHGRVTVIELGSGSAVKTQILLRALLAGGQSVSYVPLDLSRAALQDSSQRLLAACSGLRITAVVGEYRDGLTLLREGFTYPTPGTQPSGGSTEAPRLILWLGSNIGNLERNDAADFLRELGDTLRPRDRLLVGIDLRKERATLEQAYDDSRGITAEFNGNILVRINRELGGHFEPSAFRHRAIYNEPVGRIEMYLVSTRAQRVPIDRLGLEVPFEQDEAIHTENSYKYSTDEIDVLADAANLNTRERWFDGARRFCVTVFGANV